MALSCGKMRLCAIAMLAGASFAHAAANRDYSQTTLPPTEQAGQEYAPNIFNTVHHAMRQWGSSLHHNGMSFFLATVPEGVLLHHGSYTDETPAKPDWLAFEIEHAEAFTQVRPRRPQPPPGKGHPGPGSSPHEIELPLLMDHHFFGPAAPDGPDYQPGYLHVYRTTQPLRLLYVDGMGAAKTDMGTLDTQDYVLRGLEPREDDDPMKGPPPWGESQRAEDLCGLCDKLGLQGVIRMECGFEIIKCNFTAPGLEKLSALRRPNAPPNQLGVIGSLEFLRALAERYDGIGAGRASVDFSSMVSAYFYAQLDLENPDSRRAMLPRLSNVAPAQLALIKGDVERMVKSRLNATTTMAPPPIDWQGISDLIVGRYADRLQYMAEGISTIQDMKRELLLLITMHINGDDDGDDDSDKSADDDGEPAINRCTAFYLGGATSQSRIQADTLILQAFTRVTHTICTTLFSIRKDIAVGSDDQQQLSRARQAVRDLAAWLDWTRFKRCRPGCAIGEVCTVPMWPMGAVWQWERPECSNGSFPWKVRESYWEHYRRGGKKRPDKQKGEETVGSGEL